MPHVPCKVGGVLLFKIPFRCGGEFIKETGNQYFGHLPSKFQQFAMENGPFIDVLPIKWWFLKLRCCQMLFSTSLDQGSLRSLVLMGLLLGRAKRRRLRALHRRVLAKEKDLRCPKSWYPKASKSWMTILVLKPMVTWDAPVWRKTHNMILKERLSMSHWKTSVGFLVTQWS